MVFYPNPINSGLLFVGSLGDGYTVNLRWHQAYTNSPSNRIAYNIYYSTVKETVFTEGVKYVSIDNSLEANIINLIPGQLYFFCVRPVEYDSALYDLTNLPLAYDNLRLIPSSLLRSNITTTDLTIPLLDVFGFPDSGIIKMGVELIQYTSVSSILSNLDGYIRGYNNTNPRIHNVDGYDGYKTWDPIVNFWIIGEDRHWDKVFQCQSRFEYPQFQRTEEDGYHQVTKDLLTSDLSVSDDYNVDFPAYDYSGWHRTDPVQLLNGTCVGSYIGGEQGCIDKYGNFQMLRGFSLQDHNNQRQELGLSVTGKPAVLIKRVRTGITCSCYQPSSEYPDDRCPLCFAEGTLINTKNGFIPIENINNGDYVLSFDGEYHRVVNTFAHNYNGKLKKITTSTTVEPILCTPEHSFWSLGGSHKNPNGCGPNSNCKEYIKRGDGKRSVNDIKKLPSGRWYARATIKGLGRQVVGTFDTKEEAKIAINTFINKQCSGHHIVGKKAEKLTNKDWLINKWYRNINNLEEIDFPLVIKRKIKNIKIKVDEEFLWIVGLFLAEGSTSRRSLQFSLHKNEVFFQNRIMNYFEKMGISCSKYDSSKNGVVVYIYNTSLSKWFSSWLGKGCQNKKIPNELMFLPNNKSKSLIQGIYDGDSIKRDNDLVQTSKLLALQVCEILHRLGEQPNARMIVNKTLTKNGNVRKIAYGVSRSRSTATHINRKGRWQFNENLLTNVKSVETIDYSGIVYNLEIEDIHDYVVQNISVWNCHGTKFVFGYEQYFNPRRSDGRIMVRPGPTDEDVKMTEAGLESEFPVEFWTLTIPTIKDRDILILYDMDGNEEYRYEVLSVTRNNTVLELQGGQKIKAQRIRKTDPAYQIRIFSDTSMFPSQLNTSIGFTTGIVPHTHKITRNETDISNWSQTTSVSQGHNHVVIFKNNLLTVLPAVGHAHTVII